MGGGGPAVMEGEGSSSDGGGDYPLYNPYY